MRITRRSIAIALSKTAEQLREPSVLLTTIYHIERYIIKILCDRVSAKL